MMQKGYASQPQQKAGAAKTIANNRDFATIKELCGQLQQLTVGQRQECTLRGLKDLNELKKMSDKIRNDEEMAIIELEALVGIINSAIRRQFFRSKSSSHLDEKG